MPEKSALWSSFDTTRRIIDFLTKVLYMLGTGLILLLVLLINSDVVGRALFGAPVSGVPEMVSLSIVAIVFLVVTRGYIARIVSRLQCHHRCLTHTEKLFRMKLFLCLNLLLPTK